MNWCRINIQDYQGGSRYSRLPEQVPILNYDLENDQETFISKMTIRFNVSADMNDISTTLTPRVERRTDQPLIPRVVLYKKDPETLVTRNRSSKILENAANVSNFYTLDTSKLTKSKGGFIAPTKSASDFESPVKEGITFYNNSNATETSIVTGKHLQHFPIS